MSLLRRKMHYHASSESYFFCNFSHLKELILDLDICSCKWKRERETGEGKEALF